MRSIPSCASGSDRRKPGRPDCRLPSTSPPPRSRKSSSAMANPSSVSRSSGQAAPHRLGQPVLVQQQAVALRGAAPHPAAQLVQLRQAEPLGVLHHHHAGAGHVDPDLDHRGRHQQPVRPAANAASAASRTAPSCWPCASPTRRRTARAGGEPRLGRGQVAQLALSHQGADPVHLLAPLQRAADALDHARPAWPASAAWCGSAAGRPASRSAG